MKYAFSLVELSIVLVILGFLTGGILTGQSLIEAAELRAVGRDFTAIQTSINMYKARYFAMPGDHNRAYDFFDGSGGRDICGRGPANATTASSNCNGDGNGRIASGFGGENLLLWRHLNLSSLSNFALSGTVGDNMYHRPNVMPGFHAPNMPASPLGGTTGYTLHYTDRYGNGGTRYGYVGHGIALSSDTNGSSGHHSGGALTPTQAYQIDNKLDDGDPSSGLVSAASEGVEGYRNCALPTSGEGRHDAFFFASAATKNTLEYNFQIDDPFCLLFYNLGF